MNIGEKDADGWTYVRFGDAAKAAQDGTHEYQAKQDGGEWFCNLGFYRGKSWQYRIREKARTITVTIPRASHYKAGPYTSVIVRYSSEKGRDTCLEAIRAAMEQS